MKTCQLYLAQVMPSNEVDWVILAGELTPSKMAFNLVLSFELNIHQQDRCLSEVLKIWFFRKFKLLCIDQPLFLVWWRSQLRFQIHICLEHFESPALLQFIRLPASNPLHGWWGCRYCHFWKSYCRLLLGFAALRVYLQHPKWISRNPS